MRAGVLADSKTPAEEIIRMQSNDQRVFWEPEYLSEAWSALGMLKFMPSAETVSVLGHFLNNPQGRDGRAGRLIRRQTRHSVGATPNWRPTSSGRWESSIRRSHPTRGSSPESGMLSGRQARASKSHQSKISHHPIKVLRVERASQPSLQPVHYSPVWSGILPRRERAEIIKERKMGNHGIHGIHGKRGSCGELGNHLLSESVQFRHSLCFRVFRVFRGSHF